MKILIVDDDPVQRRVLLAYLQKAGHKVIEAGDGQAGLQAWLAERPRLVITDWMMPGMDGAEFIAKIRAAEADGYTYIVMLTAREGQRDMVAGLEAGSDDYLVKPFDPGELRARLTIGERIIQLETRLSEALIEMEKLATHDSLTGLINRRAIYVQAEAELSRAERAARPLCIVLLDIDHFKRVNDRYGHLVGDQALRMVAQVLLANKRIYDGAGRWGGEEFILVLPEANLPNAGAIAERLRQSLAATPIELRNHEKLYLQASLGVACTSAAGYELEKLLQQADQALYTAKNQGRNQVALFTENGCTILGL